MKKLKHSISIENQNGFTIVELLIATTVFSVVLVVILYGVLSFTGSYYRGVNTSSLQNTTRSIANNVSQAVQFSGNIIQPPKAVTGSPVGAYYICAGGVTYFYAPGLQFSTAAVTSATNPGLFAEPGSCSGSVNFSDPRGKELLNSGMRVTYLDLQAVGGYQRVYSFGVGVTLGDNDLLCDNHITTGAGKCGRGSVPFGTGPVTGTDPNDTVCNNVSGSRFCAHAGLSTTVSLRVTSSDLNP